MTNSDAGVVQPPRFLDALYADPAITACSLLSSQLYDRASNLLNDGPNHRRQFIVADEFGSQTRMAERYRYLGATAANNQLLFADLGVSREKTSSGLYAQFRSDVLIEVARFAVIGAGPCNYVQFPGELQEGVVATPMDEEERKPLLQQILAVKPGHRFINRSGDRATGYGLEARDEWNAALSDYLFCSPDQKPQVSSALSAQLNKNSFGFITAVEAAYATIVDRFDGSPLERALQNAGSETRQVYQQAVRMLHDDLYCMPEMQLIGLPDELFIGRQVKQAVSSSNKPVEELVTGDLDKFIYDRFERVFGVRYSQLHEKVLETIFNVGNAVVEATVKDGYKAKDNSADVKYRLFITGNESDIKKDLGLYAKIVTMTDTEATLCGSFKADKLGSLVSVKSNGDLVDLTESELDELYQIVGYGEIVMKSDNVPQPEIDHLKVKKRRLWKTR